MMIKHSRPETTITFLEMRQAPTTPKPALDILRQNQFTPAEFLALYQGVGADYYWTDKLEEPTVQLEAFCKDPKNTLFILKDKAETQGFFILHENQSLTDIAYFGLLPNALGKKRGSALLDYAIAQAWERPSVKKLTVNTCTLDHPRALPLYLSRGFKVIDEIIQDARN